MAGTRATSISGLRVRVRVRVLAAAREEGRQRKMEGWRVMIKRTFHGFRSRLCARSHAAMINHSPAPGLHGAHLLLSWALVGAQSDDDADDEEDQAAEAAPVVAAETTTTPTTTSNQSAPVDNRIFTKATSCVLLHANSRAA